MAAFNGEQWIEEQFLTISSQYCVDVEIFISVDRSVDRSLSIVEKLSEEFSFIHLLPYGSIFGSAASNFYRLIRDVEFKKFDYVSLSDQDDLWLPQKLIRAINCICSEDVYAYSSDVIAFWSDGREKLVKKSFPQKQLDFLFEAAGPGCTYVLKKEAMVSFQVFLDMNWDAVNKVDCHDWLIYAYCRSANFGWYIDSVPLMRYRQHSSNLMGLNSGIKAYVKRLKLIKSRWYRNEAEKIYSLINSNLNKEVCFNKTFFIANFFLLRRRIRDSILLLIFFIFFIF